MAQQCLRSALRILGRRDHSCAELRGKLRLRGFTTEMIDAAIAECQRLSYLDDDRFCQHYTAYLRRKGYGVLRIQQMLNGKGLAAEQVAACLYHQCDGESQLDDCRKVLQKKIGAGAGSTQDAARLYRFLCGRGFTSAVARQVVTEKRD